MLWSRCVRMGQQSKQIGAKSDENLSQNYENLVSGRPETILCRWLRQGRVWWERGHGFGWTFGRKGNPKLVFLEIPKIENGTQIQPFSKDRHQGPLKTVPGSGFEKPMKTRSGMIGFIWSKTIKNIKEWSLFLILGHSQKLWKNDAKGDPKSHVFFWSKMATWTF